MSPPRILFLTSTESSGPVASALLAALEVTEARVSALDVGRLGSEGTGAVEWVMRHLGGELAERKLEREIEHNPPDAAAAMDLGAVTALCALREKAPRDFSVLAVVPDWQPSAAWAHCEADRFLVVDDDAAVMLSDHGIDGERIVSVGALGESRFAAAGRESIRELRQRFKLQGRVVLIEAAGLGLEMVTQLTLQLSLVGADATYLFDAGGDKEAAAALRAQVPALGLRAKLFGVTEDAARYWRCADVVVARPTERAVARAWLVGARMVCLGADDPAGKRLAATVEARRRGAAAASALLVSSAIDSMLAQSVAELPMAGWDGARNAAEALFLVGMQRQAMVEERSETVSASRRERVEQAAGFAEWAARASAPAGDLEDLGGSGPAPDLPSTAELDRLLQEVRRRRERCSKTAADAQKQAGSWDAKRAQADKLGNRDMAREAERNADLERARMHAALRELAELQAEEQRLADAIAAAQQVPEAASSAPPRGPEPSRSPRTGGGTSQQARPSVDDELDKLKRQATGGTRATARPSESKKPSKPGSTVDDELEALKRKMAAQKRKR